MKSWSLTSHYKYKATIAALAVLLLLAVTVVPASASPLAISAVGAGNITATSATITWTTDEAANSTVNYGNTTALGSTATDSANVTGHAVALASLTPETLYYYEVSSTAGNTTVTDDNGGAYYTFTTATSINLSGWGWCTDYTEIANATFVGSETSVPRAAAPEVSDIHVVGNLTLTLANTTTETIALDMWGTKTRSLFELHQDKDGKSASFRGIWLTGNSSQYLTTSGRVTLPQGEVFKSAKIYLLQLKTTGVEIPDRTQDGFVADLEYTISMFAKFTDGLIDKLMSTPFSDVLAAILTKIMVLVAALRDMGIPYIP